MSSSLSGETPTRGYRDKGKAPSPTVTDYQKLIDYQNCLGVSLIDDILASVNNDVDEALPLLKEMFISENIQDINGKGKEVKSSRNNDYEFFDTQGASLVGVPVPSKFEADFYSPWADEDLIEDILASYNNDVDVASSSIAAMFNFEPKDRNIEKVDTNENGFESFDTIGAPFEEEEEEEEEEEDMSFIDSSMIPSKYEEDYFYPWVDESLIEDILAGLSNDVDPASSSRIEAIINSDDKDMNVKKVDRNGNELESFDTDRSFIPGVLSEYDPNYFDSGANGSWIEDIFSGVNSNVDVDVASSLIEAMLNLEIEDVHAKKVNSIGNDLKSLEIESASLAEKADLCSITGGPSKYEVNYFDPWVVETLIEDILAGGNVDVASSIIEAMFNSADEDIGIEKVDTDVNDLECVGTQEPSLVEKTDGKVEDVYQLHRRDALKVIRSARQHSAAAKDAHAKGDGVAARRYARIAKEEWIRAKKLNAEAAKEILAEKNRKNDLWTLDLHGLHESEAVDALRQRLQTVESLLQKSDLLAALVQSKNHTKKAKLGKHCPAPKPRQIRLRAITGKGNHSVGAAKLTPAVGKFLKEKGYNFDASKPGSFLIQPKFREQ